MSEIVDDPRFPDRIGVGDGPGIPCKVTEIVATTAPTGAPIGQGPDLNAVYDEVNQYRIRYELPPAPVAPNRATLRTLADLAEVIGAKVVYPPTVTTVMAADSAARINQWAAGASAALLAVLALHSGEDHQCPAEVEGYTVMSWHDEDDPCPTVRAIAKALGIEVPNV